MHVIRGAVLIVCLGALIGSVFRARQPGTFPIATLVRRWCSPRPSTALAMMAVSAGVASVVVVPLIGLLGGWTAIRPAGSLSGVWIASALAGVAAKAAFVFFEELIFRGALVSELRRWTSPAIATGVSALAFAAAHTGRPPIDMAILFADGIGFAFAFVATGSLWAPLIWHFSKNLSVWLVFGSGTIDLTHGPVALPSTGPERWFGAPGRAGLLELAVTFLVVGLVILKLRGGRAALGGALARKEPE